MLESNRYDVFDELHHVCFHYEYILQLPPPQTPDRRAPDPASGPRRPPGFGTTGALGITRTDHRVSAQLVPVLLTMRLMMRSNLSRSSMSLRSSQIPGELVKRLLRSA